MTGDGRSGAKKTATAKRFARVGEQLALGVVVGALYYWLTTTLVDRYGRNGYLIAVIAIGVAAALWREFGKDIAKWWKGLFAKKPSAAAPAKTASGAPKPAAQGAPAAITTFTRADAEPIAKSGARFIDAQGKFWGIQADTGKWAFYKGGQWHPGLPLGNLTQAEGK